MKKLGKIITNYNITDSFLIRNKIHHTREKNNDLRRAEQDKKNPLIQYFESYKFASPWIKEKIDYKPSFTSKRSFLSILTFFIDKFIFCR